MKAVTPIRNNIELNALRRQVRPLVGQLCWRARLGYAGELKLDIGDKLRYKSTKLEGQIHGAWRLGSRGTAWRLESEGRSISFRSSRPRIEEALSKMAGDVDALTIGYRQLGLKMRFKSGWTLTIEHRADRPTYDVPYWEIFTPQGTCIQAGPGRRWSIRK